jgi:hypothetical protein
MEDRIAALASTAAPRRREVTAMQVSSASSTIPHVSIHKSG